MTIQRMDHVAVVVDDVEAAIAFFVELGMELEGEAPIEGCWVDRVVGLDGVRVDRQCGDPASSPRLSGRITTRPTTK
jgi:catechol 2,3-dioxygenase-like lactoylglutathione lyase family enzyme